MNQNLGIRRRAFTLVELLTVIAITAILLTIIVLPIFQAFNLTRAAEGFSDAQDKARSLTERIAREIGNGRSVRDNTGMRGALTLYVPAKAGSGLPGNVIAETLPNVKLDILDPAQGDPGVGPSGALIDPYTGKEDPTLRSPKGQVVLPVSPGGTMVRYFVGPRNPFANYNDPYTGLLMARNSNQDNLFVLYRAEVQPMVYDPNSRTYKPNQKLFDVDANGQIVLDDPLFFTPDRDANGVIISAQGGGATKADHVRQWLRTAVVMTEVSRYDMIQPVYNKSSRQMTFDGNAPRLLPLVQFRPTRVTNEAANGMVAVRQGEESEGSQNIGPDVYRTQYGAWTSAIIRTYETGWLRSDQNLNAYEAGRKANRAGNPGAPAGFSIYVYDPDTDPNPQKDDSLVGDLFNGSPVGTEVFDVNTYEQVQRQGLLYPFTQGAGAANSRSGWYGSQPMRNLFAPYYPDAQAGRVLASFGLNEVGDRLQVPPQNDPNNLPLIDAGDEFTPLNDPAIGSGVFSDPVFVPINRKFNKIWNDYPTLRPDVHRFVDLRVAPQFDTTPSPLNPDPMVGFPRARIVPGTEEIFGPDQVAGDHYGMPIRYTRTTRTPGPNQYRMNYVDLAEPNYALLGLPNPPANYTPTNFVSAVIQPRYRAGYVQFNSDPNVPLPHGWKDSMNMLHLVPFMFSYRFQFTGGVSSLTANAIASGGAKSDVFDVDYDSRQVMSVLLTIRNYPQSSLPNPQSVTLRASATVRNFLR